MKNIILEKKHLIRQSGKAINISIAGYDCWIPKKFIIIQKNTLEINVDDNFTFQLQKYSPQENFIKTLSEVKQMIKQNNENLVFLDNVLADESFSYDFPNFILPPLLDN